MRQPPNGLPVYRLLTGRDDASFCHRVSEAIALGYRPHGSPAATFDGASVIVAQALVWPEEGRAIAGDRAREDEPRQPAAPAPGSAAVSQFIDRIRPARPAMLSEGPTGEEARVLGEHFAYLQALADSGVVLLAGRTLTPDEHAFGIVVFAAASEPAARALMDGDPAVAGGVMRAELMPFRVALWSAQGPHRDGDAG